jgi:hypothetical protein
LAKRQDFLLNSGDIDNEQAGSKLQSAVDTAASALSGLDAAITALEISIKQTEAMLELERQAAAPSGRQ